MRRQLAKWALRIAAIPVGLYVVLCAYMWAKQDELLFLPDREIIATPDKLALEWNDVTITTSDGVKLNAWWVPAKDARSTVLLCHGNGGNISYLGTYLHANHEHGMSTLVFDYRGYGKSEGSVANGDLSEEGVYRDAEAAWQWLTKEKSVAPDSIVLWGLSMGGGVCSWLAKEHGGKALVLDSTFTSMPDVAARIYPFLPVRLLSSFQFRTIDRLPELALPVLVAHAIDDSVIPYDHAKTNYAAVKSRKLLIDLRGDHNGGFDLTPGSMEKAAAFLHGLP